MFILHPFSVPSLSVMLSLSFSNCVCVCVCVCVSLSLSLCLSEVFCDWVFHGLGSASIRVAVYPQCFCFAYVGCKKEKDTEVMYFDISHAPLHLSHFWPADLFVFFFRSGVFITIHLDSISDLVPLL